MSRVHVVASREFAAYFATPVACVILVIFLLLQGTLTFNAGSFFARDQADLAPFFGFLPWVLLLLVPALSMRLWAEERRSGTIEALLTLPITDADAVLGKFLAAWALCALALLLTGPIVVTVNVLGSPDNGAIASGYFGALLVAGAYLALGGAASAATRNPVVAFVGALALCVLLAAMSYPLVTDFVGKRAPGLATALRRAGVLARYEGFTHGLIALPDLVYFAAVGAVGLFVTVGLVATRKAA